MKATESGSCAQIKWERHCMTEKERLFCCGQAQAVAAAAAPLLHRERFGERVTASQ